MISNRIQIIYILKKKKIGRKRRLTKLNQIGQKMEGIIEKFRGGLRLKSEFNIYGQGL
jgi:hypothetical protein